MTLINSQADTLAALEAQLMEIRRANLPASDTKTSPGHAVPATRLETMDVPNHPKFAELTKLLAAAKAIHALYLAELEKDKAATGTPGPAGARINQRLNARGQVLNAAGAVVPHEVVSKAQKRRSEGPVSVNSRRTASPRSNVTTKRFRGVGDNRSRG